MSFLLFFLDSRARVIEVVFYLKSSADRLYRLILYVPLLRDCQILHLYENIDDVCYNRMRNYVTSRSL